MVRLADEHCNISFPWPHRALSWIGSHAERCQSPFPLMRTNGPIFAGASDDPSVSATLVVILNLLPQTATPFLSGAWAESAAFSQLA